MEHNYIQGLANPDVTNSFGLRFPGLCWQTFRTILIKYRKYHNWKTFGILKHIPGVFRLLRSFVSLDLLRSSDFGLIRFRSRFPRSFEGFACKIQFQDTVYRLVEEHCRNYSASVLILANLKNWHRFAKIKLAYGYTSYVELYTVWQGSKISKMSKFAKIRPLYESSQSFDTQSIFRFLDQNFWSEILITDSAFKIFKIN